MRLQDAESAQEKNGAEEGEKEKANEWRGGVMELGEQEFYGWRQKDGGKHMEVVSVTK